MPVVAPYGTDYGHAAGVQIAPVALPPYLLPSGIYVPRQHRRRVEPCEAGRYRGGAACLQAIGAHGVRAVVVYDYTVERRSLSVGALYKAYCEVGRQQCAYGEVGVYQRREHHFAPLGPPAAVFVADVFYRKVDVNVDIAKHNLVDWLYRMQPIAAPLFAFEIACGGIVVLVFKHIA